MKRESLECPENLITDANDKLDQIEDFIINFDIVAEKADNKWAETMCESIQKYVKAQLKISILCEDGIPSFIHSQFYPQYKLWISHEDYDQVTNENREDNNNNNNVTDKFSTIRSNNNYNGKEEKDNDEKNEQNNNNDTAANENSHKNYTSMKLTTLKELCKQRGLTPKRWIAKQDCIDVLKKDDQDKIKKNAKENAQDQQNQEPPHKRRRIAKS